MQTPIDIIPTQNTLGEGILWDSAEQQLWWTDIQERHLYRCDPETHEIETFPLPERLGSFGLVEGSTKIIAAFESGFALYQPETAAIDWLVRPPHASDNIRFNDGRVDRQGRFWAGSMVEGDGAPRGRLYRLDRDGTCTVCEDRIAISNSLCFSPDGRYAYFADSPARAIQRYDIDAQSGAISNRRLFAATSEGAYPDGAQVDGEGCVWSAHWGAGQIVRYATDGAVVGTIALPVTQPTCVAFGGKNMDLLFVTTAREGLSEQVLAAQPHAGAVLVYRVMTQGLPDARFIWNKIS